MMTCGRCGAVFTRLDLFLAHCWAKCGTYNPEGEAMIRVGPYLRAAVRDAERKREFAAGRPAVAS